MKYFFFLLVFSNCLLYLWETGMNRPATTAMQSKAEIPASTERIVLLTELPKPQANPSPTPDSAIAAQSPATEPEPKAVTVPNNTAEPAPTALTEEALPNPEKAPTSCYRLGPFISSKQANRALSKLGAAQEGVRLVKKNVPVETGYLILSPPENTPEAAQAKRKQLAEKGFKDAWVVKQGESRYAVSLAAVNEKGRAEDTLSRYRAKGIEAEIKPRMGDIDQWWLEVRDEAGRKAIERTADQAETGSNPTAVKVCD
jgi:hypothetical protein